MVRQKTLHGDNVRKFEVQRKIGHNNLKNGGSEISYFPYIGDSTKNMGDVWNNDMVEVAAANHNGQHGKTKHPAPFPLKLVVLPLLQTTQENDLVFDPFYGSGTTGDVASAYGRKYVGYDVKVYD